MSDRFLLTLPEYERLAREYIDETFNLPERMAEQLKLSEFIVWLRRREEKSNDEVGKRRSASTTAD